MATRALPFRSSIRHILCPTDLTPASDRAITHAALLAETFGAELTLLHEIDLRRVVRGKTSLAESIRRTELGVLHHLDERAARTSAATRLVVDYCVSPHEGVAAAIAAHRPDLTVMSTHGRRGAARLLRGSVAENAVEGGASPILCVPGTAHPPGPGYRRILLPTDLRSRKAFPLASAMARAFDAEVVALHLVPPPAPPPTDADLLRFLGPPFAGTRVRARVEAGAGWESIPEIAAEGRFDLVILTTHRHDSLADALLGTRAERIVATSPCPALVV